MRYVNPDHTPSPAHPAGRIAPTELNSPTPPRSRFPAHPRSVKAAAIAMGPAQEWASGGGGAGFEYLGGYYAGIMDTTQPGSFVSDEAYTTGLRYELIVAPKSLEITDIFNSVNGYHLNTSEQTRWNGLQAQRDLKARLSEFQFGYYDGSFQYCDSLAYPSDGASEWYLPSLDELILMFSAFKPGTQGLDTTGFAFGNGDLTPYTPGVCPSDPPLDSWATSPITQTPLADFQAGGAQALDSNLGYMSSTAYSTTSQVRSVKFNPSAGDCSVIGIGRLTNARVRPVRRNVLT